MPMQDRQGVATSSDPWMTAMLRGDFAAAWEISDRVLAERRACKERCSDWPRHRQFIWDGSAIDGKRVLVRCYHGLGDTIQYVRLLEPLHRRAREVILWAQPALLPILRGVHGIDRLLPLHDGVIDVPYDVDLELMEVAHALRITLADLPGRSPHLEIRGNFTLRDSDELRVGLTWRSGDWNPERSIPIGELQPLARLPGIAFFSLQYPAEKMPFAATQLACRDIARMARRLASLDVVISVDTMVAHLAAAAGRTTWLLLHEHPDWRWLAAGSSSPWYPTMRLFRRTGSDWHALLARVRTALLNERDGSQWRSSHPRTGPSTNWPYATRPSETWPTEP